MGHSRFAAILTFLFLVLSKVAHAVCASPAGAAGQVQWIPGDTLVKYCDGTNWNSVLSAVTGTGCANPGEMTYRSSEIQFCNGTNWVQTNSGALHGNCTQGAGAINYDSSSASLRWCNGTHWRLMGPTAPAITLNFLGRQYTGLDQTTYTFTGQSFGTASRTRYVIMSIAARAGSVRTVSSVTIGGVAATQIAYNASGTSITAFFAAHVPTGTSGNLVITFSGGVSRIGVGVWGVENLTSLTPVDLKHYADPTSASDSVSINATAGGVVLAALYTNYATGTSWTSLTENDEVINTDSTLDVDFSWASAAYATNQVGLTVTTTGSGTIADRSGSVISLR